MVQRLDCRIIKFLCRHCAAFSFCREVVKLAATRLIALHKNKGKSVAACLKSRTDYVQNPDKTEHGELISSYECNPLTVDEEFMLSKRQYELVTGRRQKSDVIAYQIRQSFKPGEITAEEANKVGYELAMRFTKGKYAFIVATHTDREHIHNHIIYNSTALDSTRKFRDFLLSGLAVQRLSDLICLEHQLSVIEIKPYRERQKRTLYPPKESNRDRLCGVIPKEQIVTKRYEKENAERKNHLQDLQTQRNKAEKDLFALKTEVLACIKGESVLPRETLAEMITAQEEKLTELENLCEAASEELEKTAELMDKVSRLYDELISYADLYDSANFEAKKMIVNQLIRRVDVYRGYQINISFNFDLTPYIEGE